MSGSDIPSLIERKRDGGELSKEDIQTFVESVVKGTIQDSQIGAMLMAIYLKGMSTAETVELTRAMTFSGDVFTFPQEWADLLVDKHSTGGIGDKISLILAPALAQFGLKVPMVSGRGLGFTGGTLDKLESIPGFKTKLTQEEMTCCLNTAGCFIAGATKSLAPADAVLYQQRDITSTVGCLPLIVSSILSKKVAEGTKALVMDVKVGRGTFLKNEEHARAIADLLIKISDGLGVKTNVVLSRMDHPLGRAVGNAVEVEESLACLKGDGPEDIQLLVNTLGAVLLVAKERSSTIEEGRQLMAECVSNGSALKCFYEMLIAQGVEEKNAKELCYGDCAKVLPQPPSRTTLFAPKDGYVNDIDALALGLVTWKLGAGRTKASDSVNHSVGLMLKVQLGQKIASNDPLLDVLHNDQKLPSDLIDQLQAAIIIGAKPSKQSSILVDIIGN